MSVLLVAQLGTNDAWADGNDYARGLAYGHAAVAAARAEGIPDGVGIACAADAHAPDQRSIDKAVQFVRGFAAGVGQERAGFYGFAETIRAVHAANAVSWYWRCGSAPAATDRPWVNLWQRNDGTITVNGTECDVNETYAPLGGGVGENEMIASEIWNYPIPTSDGATSHTAAKWMAGSQWGPWPG